MNLIQLPGMTTTKKMKRNSNPQIQPTKKIKMKKNQNQKTTTKAASSIQFWFGKKRKIFTKILTTRLNRKNLKSKKDEEKNQTSENKLVRIENHA